MSKAGQQILRIEVLAKPATDEVHLGDRRAWPRVDRIELAAMPPAVYG